MTGCKQKIDDHHCHSAEMLAWPQREDLFIRGGVDVKLEFILISVKCRKYSSHWWPLMREVQSQHVAIRSTQSRRHAGCSDTIRPGHDGH